MTFDDSEGRNYFSLVSEVNNYFNNEHDDNLVSQPIEKDVKNNKGHNKDKTSADKNEGEKK